MKVEVEGTETDDIISQLMNSTKYCPMCAMPLVFSFKITKLRQKIIHKHFCSVVNGNCVVTRTRKLKITKPIPGK